MDWLATPSGALLAWGLCSRGLGLVFAISLGAYAYQARALSGSHGLTPMAGILARYRRDFGGWRAAWYLPSLFWVSCSDTALVAVPAAGALAGLGAVVGGAWAPALLAASWAALLSMDGAAYPWDSLLLEAGFLAIWLPATSSLADTSLHFPASASATSAPSPLLSFAFRWLLFRVLVGFGKLKFVGSGWRDRLYIKNFIMNQPMVSMAGWLAFHTVPDTLWAVLLLGMFGIECIAPFFLFVTGPPRLVAAAHIAALMAGIQLTGVRAWQ